MSWTVDAQKAREFVDSYIPKTDLLLVQIAWNRKGALSYIPLETQHRVLGSMGREEYLKLPKPGTNPRGVEISKTALAKLLNDRGTKSAEIEWKRSDVEYDPYQRWVEYWKA